MTVTSLFVCCTRPRINFCHPCLILAFFNLVISCVCQLSIKNNDDGTGGDLKQAAVTDTERVRIYSRSGTG